MKVHIEEQFVCQCKHLDQMHSLKLVRTNRSLFFLDLMPEYVYALYDFHPEDRDEIALRAGDRIELIQKDGAWDDWFEMCNSDASTEYSLLNACRERMPTEESASSQRTMSHQRVWLQNTFMLHTISICKTRTRFLFTLVTLLKWYTSTTIGYG